MFTLLSTIIAFLTSSLPSVIKTFDNKNKREHELKMQQTRLDLVKLEGSLAFDRAVAEANSATMVARLEADTHLNVPVWMNIFRSSVRPVITYTFFTLYVFIKMSMVWQLLQLNILTVDALNIVWTEMDGIILGSIIGFYFGGRSVERSKTM